MDGTLANVSSIRHFLHKFDKGRKWKDFHSFHAESVNVPPNPEVVNHAQVAHLLGYAIIIVTARSQMWRGQTAMWLAINGVPSDAMFMRKNGDHKGYPRRH